APLLPGIKRFCFFSQEKRSRPFLVTFSGEAEKVTARRVGVPAVNRRTAESLFQTPYPAPNRELFVPALRCALKRTPPPPQPQSNRPQNKKTEGTESPGFFS
ncbi:MAG: hypothetical protein LBQ91_06100, partial [Oscillospiraceae bacterium]|nr:hypothetical protein [Oscillospiraceae bacterium]